MKKLTFLACLLALSLGACAKPTASPTPGPDTALPAPTRAPSAETLALPRDQLIADWKISVAQQIYRADNLFSLVDGQADAFLAYNFEQVTTERYENNAGTLLTVEVWQLAQPADAYGLFTVNRAG
jgi:hypothetical protein